MNFMSKFLGESWLKILVGRIFLAGVFPDPIVEQWFSNFSSAGGHEAWQVSEGPDLLSECLGLAWSLTSARRC